MISNIEMVVEKNKAVRWATQTALNNATTKKPKFSKRQVMLKALYETGEVGINRFEALPLGDTVLNSTVPDLQKMYGIEIDRKHETVIRPNGNTATVCRYWLRGENREIAHGWLVGWGMLRNDH